MLNKCSLTLRQNRVKAGVVRMERREGGGVGALAGEEERKREKQGVLCMHEKIGDTSPHSCNCQETTYYQCSEARRRG